MNINTSPPTDAGSDTSIVFDAAGNCQILFDDVQKAFEHDHQPSDDAISDKEGVKRLSGLRSSFYHWIEYTGARSSPESSLDTRLQGFDEVTSMVLELLDMVARNLQRLIDKHIRSSQLEQWDEDLNAVNEAIDRLHFLAIAIRKASVKRLHYDIKTFLTDEDTTFLRYARTYVRWRFPAAPKVLCNQLGDSIAVRRRILLRKYKHEQRLKKPRNINISKVVPSQDEKLTKTNVETSLQMKVHQAATTSGLSSTYTKASKPSHQGKIMEYLKRGPKTVLSSIQSQKGGGDDSIQYPDPPRVEGGDKPTKCPYCELSLETTQLQDPMSGYWIRHVNEDLQPYICLFPQCSNALIFFVHLQEWRDHMERVHSKAWPKTVHNLRYFCDMGHEPPLQFSTEDEWIEHMESLESHPGRFQKAPTKAQLNALATRKQQLVHRDNGVCPLCECVPDGISRLISKLKPDELLEKLTLHIAGHVKSVALISLPSFEAPLVGPTVDPSSDEFFNIISRSTVSNRASHQDNMSNATLTFNDIPIRERSPEKGLALSEPDSSVPSATLNRFTANESFDSTEMPLLADRMQSMAELDKSLLAEMNSSDLDDSIRVVRQFLQASSQGDPNWVTQSTYLGCALKTRAERTASVVDINEAINIAHQTVDAIDDGHQDQVIVLCNLSAFLRSRYAMTASMVDLDQAIQLVHRAIAILSSDDSERAVWLNNLGILLKDRFESTGVLADLDEAIEAQRQAEQARRGHPDWAEFVADISHLLQTRFNRTGALTDIDEAIDLRSQAANTVSSDRSTFSKYLYMVGNCCYERFRRTVAVEDLDRALDTVHKAVGLTDASNVNFSVYLARLGDFHMAKFKISGNPMDLQDAIDMAGCAIDATSPGHRNLAERMSRLGTYFRLRFDQTTSMEDLNKSISMANQAVEAIPQSHVTRAELLTNLGNRLEIRYGKEGVKADLEMAYGCYSEAFSMVTAPTLQRVVAASCLFASPWAHLVCKDVVKLVPVALELLQPMAGSSQNPVQEYLHSQALELASNATALALMAGESPEEAVTWLEMGRGLLADGLEHTITDLRTRHPELADSFIKQRGILDSTIPDDLVTNGSSKILSTESQRRRRQAQQELDIAIGEIRKHPGFEQFLAFPSKNEILDAASDGPLVIINVSLHRCDALIIEVSCIRSVKLSDDLYKDIVRFREKISTPSPDLLEWLWDGVVGPILSEAGIHLGEQLPRLWWIPTGPLLGFPLHAAGYHSEGKGRTALDRVVSSWKLETKNLVLVATEKIPNFDSLVHASREIATVEEVANSMEIYPMTPERSKGSVQSAMRNCDIFHFIGDYIPCATQPLQSQLLLEDWEDGSLKVQSLLDIKRSGHLPFLAYLSTSRMSDMLRGRSVRDNIHLSSACQIAGFRHVIGAGWTANDEMCAKMAERIYTILEERDLSDDSVSYALHLVNCQFRDEWVQEKQGRRPDFGKEGYVKHWSHRMKWISNVHYGV
ncbi:TPR domain-containing [Fusarium acutatum]|uniref:TPR domain-containing n=1 Tax=Fusarium acutatum TaxID=78861 RepID=A0A8H4JN12_9HYPO|nr:TPR domain-containing [Fusarium acutatum]